MAEDKIINGKAIYTPKGAAFEYGRIGCNFYTGCPHGCTYCYLKRGKLSMNLGGTEVRLKKCFRDEKHAVDILRKDLDKYLEQCQRYGIFLSFSTDPMIDETRGLTTAAIIEATMRDIPVWVLTKSSTFIYDEGNFMVWMGAINPIHRHLIHFGFTLTGHDEMEPHANTNAGRILAMRRMSLMGFSTFASIEPVIDWNAAEHVVHESLPWCDHYKIGLRSGVKKDYYNALESYEHLNRIVSLISNSYNKTVYLKQSVRKLIGGSKDIEDYQFEGLMWQTVDMDGNPWKQIPERR